MKKYKGNSFHMNEFHKNPTTTKKSMRGTIGGKAKQKASAKIHLKQPNDPSPLFSLAKDEIETTRIANIKNPIFTFLSRIDL